MSATPPLERAPSQDGGRVRKGPSPIELHARNGQAGVSATANLLEGNQGSFSQKLRDWGEFLDSAKFLKPLDVQQCQDRMAHNLKYFTMNYVACAAVILACYALYYPPFGLRLLIGGAISGAIFFFLAEGQVIKVGQNQLQVTKTRKQIAVAVVSLCVGCSRDALLTLLSFILFSGVLVLLHAAFRSRPSIATELDRGFQAAANVVREGAFNFQQQLKKLE